jgi:2-polyprenyl-3-methyl-5-hydroxy-6-metoxy-1,4-benzoquinol methylase
MNREAGRLLDVGCGDGDFAASMKRRGWEVYGTEFSSAARQLGEAKGVKVHQGDIASAHFPDDFFDVVTLWHVLEHVPEPAVELIEIQRILRPGGLLVLETPNIASMTFRFCGKSWFPLGIPGHLQHFTPQTLARFVKRAGFRPVRRQDFHHLDILLTLISFVTSSKVLGTSESTHYFVEDYRKASMKRKMAFILGSLLIGVLSVPYAFIAPFFLGNGETVTITAQKIDPPA